MNETNGTAGAKRLAVYAIHQVPDRDDESKTHARWIRVGSAFQNRDGSMNLYLDAFPIGTNKLQVREDDRAQATAATPRRNGFETVEVRS